MVATAPTLTGVGIVVEVVVVVDVSCGAVLVVVFTDVVEDEAGATADVVVDDWHPITAGRQITMIKMIANSFFTSTSLNRKLYNVYFKIIA